MLEKIHDWDENISHQSVSWKSCKSWKVKENFRNVLLASLVLTWVNACSWTWSEGSWMPTNNNDSQDVSSLWRSVNNDIHSLNGAEYAWATWSVGMISSDDFFIKDIANISVWPNGEISCELIDEKWNVIPWIYDINLEMSNGSDVSYFVSPTHLNENGELTTRWALMSRLVNFVSSSWNTMGNTDITWLYNSFERELVWFVDHVSSVYHDTDIDDISNSELIDILDNFRLTKKLSVSNFSISWWKVSFNVSPLFLSTLEWIHSSGPFNIWEVYYDEVIDFSSWYVELPYDWPRDANRMFITGEDWFTLINLNGNF